MTQWDLLLKRRELRQEQVVVSDLGATSPAYGHFHVSQTAGLSVLLPCLFASLSPRTLDTSFADTGGREHAVPRSRIACRCSHRPGSHPPHPDRAHLAVQRDSGPRRAPCVFAVRHYPSHRDQVQSLDHAAHRGYRLSLDPASEFSSSFLPAFPMTVKRGGAANGTAPSPNPM